MNRGLWMASVLAAISGCSSDSAEQVASSATSTLSLPSTIEPAALPDVGPAFIYKAAGLRDPFRSSAVELVPRPAVARAQVQPDPTRESTFWKALLWSSSKWSARSPTRVRLLCCYVGRAVYTD